MLVLWPLMRTLRFVSLYHPAWVCLLGGNSLVTSPPVVAAVWTSWLCILFLLLGSCLPPIPSLLHSPVSEYVIFNLIYYLALGTLTEVLKLNQLCLLWEMDGEFWLSRDLHNHAIGIRVQSESNQRNQKLSSIWNQMLERVGPYTFV